MTQATRARQDRRDHRRFLSLCLALAAILIIFLGLLSSELDFFVRRFVSDIGLLAGGVLTAISCGLRSRVCFGRKRRAWFFFALAGTVAAIGNAWVLYTHLAELPDSASNYGNIGFLLALVLAVVALLLFPAVKRRGLDLARILFDGIVIGGSLLSITGVTIFPQLLNQTQVGTSRTTSLVLCVVDVMVATLAAMLVVRGNREDRVVLMLLSSGLVAYAVSDLARAVIAAQGTFAFGGPVDIGWIAGYLLFALAARHRTVAVPAQPGDAGLEATPPLVTSSITFGLFLVAALVRVWRLPVVGSTLLLSLVWVVVLLGVTLRQGLLILDNEVLRRDLERRVRDRTSELRALTRTSQTMLNSVGDGIYGVDRAGRITFVNPSAQSMLGFAEEDLIGRSAHDLFHASQPDGNPYPYPSCYVAEAAEQGLVTTSEEDNYVRAHGEAFPVEVTASPLLRNDELEGAVVAFRDMTQRREVDRMKSEFVSVVSHELRTPLTSIRGSLGLLSAGALGELSPAAKRMVKIALDSSERLTRLINDILDIERIESGTMPMQMGPHAAADLIRTAVEQVQGIAVDSDVKLQILDVHGRVWGDGDRIVQTLVNLLGNAIKFSDPRSVVDVEAALDGDLVLFRVRDQGRGIPAEKLDRVFRRFEQVDSSDAREKGGSGLGLAISRSIVERHGGEIWVESEEGHGASFFFTVPALAAPPAEDTDSGGRPMILVCDDDPSVVEVLCAVLERHGYRAVGVPDGNRAIELAAEQLPAAVLIDLMMEGTSGAEVVTSLRRNPRTRDIPLVVISGLEPSNDLDLATRADDWLVKPVGEDRLMRSLSTAISEHAIAGEVLLVEDDESVATVVRTLLERRGLKVSHARSRAEALSLVRGGRPGVLILDMQLPDGDGTDVVRAMRSDQRLTDLPVVIYSADDVPLEKRDQLQLGTTIFLTKGRVGPQHLEQRVVELIELVLDGEPASEVIGMQTAGR